MQIKNKRTLILSIVLMFTIFAAGLFVVYRDSPRPLAQQNIASTAKGDSSPAFWNVNEWGQNEWGQSRLLRNNQPVTRRLG